MALLIESISDIPPHFLIQHQFIYQANNALKGAAVSHDRGVAVPSTQQALKAIQAELRRLGWHRADFHGRENKDGQMVIRVNQDSVWYQPEHWDPDPESLPPVSAKTDEAREFLKAIRRGGRNNFGALKHQLMDEFVRFLSKGARQHWFMHAGGADRAGKLNKDRLDKQRNTAWEFPEDKVSDWMVISADVLARSAQRRGPDFKPRVEIAMRKFGWLKKPVDGHEVWYNPKHWDDSSPQVGLLPKTDEAEKYEAELPDDGRSIGQRALDDPSALLDIDVVAERAYEVGTVLAKQARDAYEKDKKIDPERGPVFRHPAEDPAARPDTAKQVGAKEKKPWIHDPNAGPDAEVQQEPPKVGRPRKDAPPKPALTPRKAAAPRDDDEDVDDDDDWEEDDEDEEDDAAIEAQLAAMDRRKMSARDLDQRAAQRTDAVGSKAKPTAAPAGKASVPAKKPTITFADDDDDEEE